MPENYIPPHKHSQVLYLAVLATRYDSEAGELRWKRDDSLVSIRPGGYVRCQKQDVSAMRVAWMHHYGCAPRSRLRALDGDSRNIKITNIADVKTYRDIVGKRELLSCLECGASFSLHGKRAGLHKKKGFCSRACMVQQVGRVCRCCGAETGPGGRCANCRSRQNRRRRPKKFDPLSPRRGLLPVRTPSGRDFWGRGPDSNQHPPGYEPGARPLSYHRLISCRPG